jgi:CRP-like cAMP-binding protein
MQIYKSGDALSKLSEQFKRIPLLRAFAGEHLKEILNASRMLVYGQDEVIIPEGEFGDHLYVLINGKVRVVKNQRPIAVLDQVGEVFGEISALDHEPRTASVIAAKLTWCLELNPSALENLPAEDRDACYALLYRFIAQVIAERLKKTTDELALAVNELDATRNKLKELRQGSGQEKRDDELELAIEQLRRTKEKLSRLGGATEPLSMA